MGAISGYGFSRGNYAQILRARNDSRSEQGRNVKTKNDKTQNEKGRGDKVRNSKGKVDADELQVRSDGKGEATKESSTTRTLGENVVVNGSFEKHSLGKNTWGLQTEIEGFKSTNGHKIELQTGVAGKASDGQTLVELDSTGNSGIYQDVKTEKGEKYQLSVDFSARPGVASESNTVEVYFEGKKIDTLNADGRGKGDTDFETKTYEVQATGDSSRLEFRAAGKSDSLGGYIDNVKLQKINEVESETQPTKATESEIKVKLGSHDYKGAARARITVDGKVVGEFDVKADARKGEFEEFSVKGDFGANGPKEVSVAFVNDAWGGTASTDRNLVVDNIEVNGKKYETEDAQYARRNDTIQGRDVMAWQGELRFDTSDNGGPKEVVGSQGGVDDAKLNELSKKLADLKQGVEKANSTGSNNGAAIGKLTEKFKDLAGKLDSVASQSTGNSKKLDSLSSQFKDISESLGKAISNTDRNSKQIDEVQQTTKAVTNKLDGLSQKVNANGKKIDDLGGKFDSLRSDLGGKVDSVSKDVDKLGSRLDVQDVKVREQINQVNDKIDQSNRDSAARDKKLGDKLDNVQSELTNRLGGTDKRVDDLGKKQDANFENTNGRIDDLGSKVDSRFEDLEGNIGSQFDSTDTKIDDLGSAVNDRLDQTDQKIDDLGSTVDSRLDQSDRKIDDLGTQVNDRLDKTDQKIDDLSNNVDDKLNDLSEKLGNQVNDVAGDLASAVKDLKDVIKDVDTQNDSQLSDTVKDLKDDFNKQFSDLKSQHEAESAALLAKLDEVTSALKTLSEQSSEQISVLKDKLGGLGGQLGTVINKIDLLSQGGGMSHRSLGLYNAAAKVGNGALDKLVGIVGGKSGNQLRGVQSQLNAVSARYGGAGQGASGLSLLA